MIKDLMISLRLSGTCEEDRSLLAPRHRLGAAQDHRPLLLRSARKSPMTPPSSPDRREMRIPCGCSCWSSLPIICSPCPMRRQL